MRKLPSLPIAWLAFTLTPAGCSDPRAAAQANAIDVGAAASRAQSDIANYAADGPPAARGVSAGPQSIIDHSEPKAVVRRYVEALATRRYADAWALWEDDGRASDMTQADFAASFARYASYNAAIGTPFGAEAGAGQRYITVPVTVTGMLVSGEPFRLEGTVVLHKVADGVESADSRAHAWRVRSSEMKPRPSAT